MKIFVILFLCSLGINALAQKIDLTSHCKQLILQTYHYYDYYESLNEETDMLSDYFGKVLLNRDSNSITSEFTREAESLLFLFYENGQCSGEHSTDARRLRMKRSLCFSSLALTTKLDKSMLFLEYAKFSLIGNDQSFKDKMLADQYLGLLLLETLLRFECEDVTPAYLNNLEIFVIEHESDLDPQNFKDVRFFIEKCREQVKPKQEEKKATNVDIEHLSF